MFISHGGTENNVKKIRVSVALFKWRHHQNQFESQIIIELQFFFACFLDHFAKPVTDA